MSQQLIEAQVRNVRFYGCGGTGINILRRYREGKSLEGEAIRANELFSYIDTGIANLHNIVASEAYVVTSSNPDHEDGAGKDRRAWAADIKAALPQIMLAHTPGDLNVVIFGTAGGTGSVAGPLLLEALLAEGYNAVGIAIGNHDSLKATTNTISTLQGLETAVQRLGRPVVIHYKENDPMVTHSQNDIVPQFVMAALSVLSSGRNAHLDRSDVRNFFDYNKVTHHAPALAMLDVYVREDDLTASIEHAITYAALLKSEADLAPRIPNDYDTVGYLPLTPQPQLNSYYFAVTTNRLAEIFRVLIDKRQAADKQKQVGQKSTSLLGGATSANDLGLVLD